MVKRLLKVFVTYTFIIGGLALGLNINELNKFHNNLKENYANYNIEKTDKYSAIAEYKESTGKMNKSVAEFSKYTTLDNYSLVYTENTYNNNKILLTRNNETINKYKKANENFAQFDTTRDSLEVVNIDEIVQTTNYINSTDLCLIACEDDMNNEDLIVFSTPRLDQSDALLEIKNPDPEYKGSIVKLTPEDREILERLVTGEAGDEGFIGACLVAQTIRDTLVYRDYDTVEEVRVKKKYAGKLTWEPTQTVKDAVSFIFDEGGIAVKHKIIYFYAPHLVKSKFHESLEFVVEHGGHRFFYGQ